MTYRFGDCELDEELLQLRRHDSAVEIRVSSS